MKRPGEQFRQDSLWGESGEWLAADRNVRRNMANDLKQGPGLGAHTENEPWPADFVESMTRSKATRADFHALEVIKPAVQMRWGQGGSYDTVDNVMEVGAGWSHDRSLQNSERDMDGTLYHEIGHALHIGGIHHGKTGGKLRAWFSPDPVQEGLADGTMDRLGPNVTDSGYRDTDEYTAQVTKKNDLHIDNGGSAWGRRGRAEYEAARTGGSRGEFPKTIGSGLNLSNRGLEKQTALFDSSEYKKK